MSSGNSTAADTTVSGLTMTTGRGTSAGRGRGVGRGRGARGGRGYGRGPRSRSTGFKGTTSEMNGNVFECYDEQTDRRQFAKTVEALEGYVKESQVRRGPCLPVCHRVKVTGA
jgi:hypothetical protein